MTVYFPHFIAFIYIIVCFSDGLAKVLDTERGGLEKRAPIQPYECRHATNITDYWRKDNKGRQYKPGGPHSYGGYACDMHMNIHWFRFSGAAGTKMLDSCPASYSCGTYTPMWTDEPMPTEVGKAAAVKAFQAYPVRGCKSASNRILVMRCSNAADDFIYKNDVTYSDPCSYAFCSM